MKLTFPFQVPALQVKQPLATYFVAVLPAELLLQTCFSDTLRAIKSDNDTYELSGTQRAVDNDRLKAIGDYISRSDSAFPNSLILAANYRAEDGFIEEDSLRRWLVEPSVGGYFTITIQSPDELAAVIDGQHRLFGFTRAAEARLGMELVCSIFFDLPKPYQAQLFATINSTQKRVDKSLTYELFGYNIAEEDANHWSPDKLAVYLARRLNTQSGSPMEDRISVAPVNDFVSEHGEPPSWRVSMATVVDGIIRLISTNPTKDGNELLGPSPRTRNHLRESPRKDSSPLRGVYLDGNDELLYAIVKNYLETCNITFWTTATPDSFIIRTVGASVVTAKPAIRGHFKTGHRDWPKT
jgi:DNA phosphorothioation-associated DGQHR protein 1